MSKGIKQRYHVSYDVQLVNITGFLLRRENLENENGHGTVIEHENLAKSHGIL